MPTPPFQSHRPSSRRSTRALSLTVPHSLSLSLFRPFGFPRVALSSICCVDVHVRGIHLRRHWPRGTHKDDGEPGYEGTGAGRPRRRCAVAKGKLENISSDVFQDGRRRRLTRRTRSPLQHRGKRPLPFPSDSPSNNDLLRNATQFPQPRPVSSLLCICMCMCVCVRVDRLGFTYTTLLPLYRPPTIPFPCRVSPSSRSTRHLYSEDSFCSATRREDRDTGAVDGSTGRKGCAYIPQTRRLQESNSNCTYGTQYGIPVIASELIKNAMRGFVMFYTHSRAFVCVCMCVQVQ